MIRRLDVYEAANRRLKIIFDFFDYVYVSFSGGKDSGVLLHLCMDYIRRHAPGRKLGVFHMDYEVQYRQSTEYVERMFSNNRDILDVFHCCVPFKVYVVLPIHFLCRICRRTGHYMTTADVLRLFLGFFQRNLAKLLHQFFQFQRSLAGTGTCGLVAFFNLKCRIRGECSIYFLYL